MLGKLQIVLFFVVLLGLKKWIAGMKERARVLEGFWDKGGSTQALKKQRIEPPPSKPTTDRREETDRLLKVVRDRCPR